MTPTSTPTLPSRRWRAAGDDSTPESRRSRILHVFDFNDSLIPREQVWLDPGSIVAPLTAPEGAEV